MHCRELLALADSYLADQLLVETNHAILRHLAECPQCRAEIEDRRRLRDALRGAFQRSATLQPSSEFLAAVGDRTRSIAGRRDAGRSWRAALAIAAALILVATSFALQAWLSARRVAELTRAAAGDHRDCALQFRLSEQPISLEEAARRFDPVYRRFATVNPDAGRVKGPLTVVARHSCVFQGRRFAHIVLSYHDQLVSVLVPVDSPALTSEIRTVDRERVIGFPTGRFTTFVVSAIAAEDLERVADAMRDPLSRALAGA